MIAAQNLDQSFSVAGRNNRLDLDPKLQALCALWMARPTETPINCPAVGAFQPGPIPGPQASFHSSHGLDSADHFPRRWRWLLPIEAGNRSIQGDPSQPGSRQLRERAVPILRGRGVRHSCVAGPADWAKVCMDAPTVCRSYVGQPTDALATLP